MKLKKLLSIGLIVVFGVTVFTTGAYAGSKQRHRWEGVAIGIGAVILGKALIDGIHHSRASVYAPPARPLPSKHHYRERPAGHWETRREWVPPQYEKVWNPGHYDDYGRWVAGRWIQIEVEQGYWVEKDVWVPHY